MLPLLAGLTLVLLALLLAGWFATPLILKVTVDYPIFYPNRSGEQRMLIIRLHTSRPANIDIEVYDELNRPVADLIKGRKYAAGEHFRLWDGRSKSGTVLPAGSYLVRATAKTTTNRATSALWVRLDPSRSTFQGPSQEEDYAQWVLESFDQEEE